MRWSSSSSSAPARSMAVTGSDGKTTSTTLIAEMLRAAGQNGASGGQPGPGAAAGGGHGAARRRGRGGAVQLPADLACAPSPDVAVVTNVTPNHLDHHKDMAGVRRRQAQHPAAPDAPGSKAVLGYENEITRAMASGRGGRAAHWFSRLRAGWNGAPFWRKTATLCFAENGGVTPDACTASEVKLRGLHNMRKPAGGHLPPWRAMARFDTMARVGAAVLPAWSTASSRCALLQRRAVVQRLHRQQPHPHHRRAAQRLTRKSSSSPAAMTKHIPYEPLAPEILAHVKVLILMGATGPIIEKAVRE